MAKSHIKKNWFKKLFGKRQKSEKIEENGSQARVPENNVQLAQEPARVPENNVQLAQEPARVPENNVQLAQEPANIPEEVHLEQEPARVPENNVQLAQEPANIPEEVHLEQVHRQNGENMQQIEELKKQLEITDQQSRQVSDEQKKFEKKTSNLDAKLHHLEQMLQDNDTKYREEIKSILVEMQLTENRHEAMCLENKVHIDNIEKLNNDLLCTEEKLHQQKLQQNSNEEKLKKQVEVLSQQLNARDKNFSEISSKNKELSEDLEKVTRKLSEVELQLEKQQQRDAQHQQQDVKNCQQIKLLLQRLNAKDKQCKQITLTNKELSEELKKLTAKFSEVELQLQDQRQQHELQKQKDVKTCQEVEVLSQRSSAKDEHLNELTLRNNVLSEDLAKMGSRFSELEQKLQEQRQWQGQHNDNYCHQVTLLMTDLKNKNDCLDAVTLKNDQIRQEMHQMCIRVQNVEQQHQEPQQNPSSKQNPCSRQNQEPQQKPCSQQKPSSPQNQEPQQKPCSQPPLEQEKPQKEQMDQNNLQRHQPRRNKEPRVSHHVIECGEKLKSTSTAWRPTKKRGMTSDDEDIIRQFRSLLNKLTPENFDRIIHQMKHINITKGGHLKDIVQLVLNKAMMESKFSEVYAIMCYHLSKIEVQQTSQPGNILNFRTLLIQGCHNEFKMGMDGSSSLDDAVSKENVRQRTLGNVIFIGELFKAKVLHESVTSDIVRGLLKDGKEQSLEYLCRLLGVVGKILDSTQRAMMNEHFTSLNRLVKGRKMSPRMRFMLQDLIDLRMRKWIPRQKVERPMYLQQIRAEASEQQQRRSHHI